jgi:hypothetical protein
VGIAQYQVLEVHEFAVEVESGASLAKMAPLDPTLRERVPLQALVETGEPLLSPLQGASERSPGQLLRKGVDRGLWRQRSKDVIPKGVRCDSRIFPPAR